MIKTKEDLQYYLDHDAVNYPVQSRWSLKRFKWNLFSNPISDDEYIWKYIKALRHLEYSTNNARRTGMIRYSCKLRRLGYKDRKSVV